MEKLANTCWQYQVKVRNLESDLKRIGMTKQEYETIRIGDLEFKYVDKTDTVVCREVKKFVERHEWLGKMPLRPTQRFIATYKGQIAAVIVMATPYGFTTKFGRENSNLEKLIARGATISWAPKFTGSWLIMKSINWMVQNTEYRIFSGYSDTEANELGTIYQACNFIYLGKRAGTRHQYFDPAYAQRGWFNDRLFRKVGQYRKYARELSIEWDHKWTEGYKMVWENVPASIESKLRQASIEYRSRCRKRRVPAKHKYVLIKGRTKRETKALIRRFCEVNPKLSGDPPKLRPGLCYPKERGL